MLNIQDKISIRIIGVEDRIDNVNNTKKILNIPESNIFIDVNRCGLIENAKNAWLKETEKPFVMVLQDDIILCQDFLHYCNKIIDRFPDSIVSLFPLQFLKRDDINRACVNVEDSPYYTTDRLSGCGIIMKTEYVKPCVSSWKKEIDGDDTNIFEWAQANKISTITTIPSTIQHIGDNSVFAPGNGIRRTEFFSNNPSYANWDCGELVPWTNLIR